MDRNICLRESDAAVIVLAAHSSIPRHNQKSEGLETFPIYNLARSQLLSLLLPDALCPK